MLTKTEKRWFYSCYFFGILIIIGGIMVMYNNKLGIILMATSLIIGFIVNVIIAVIDYNDFK
jgi:hypothetical protein